MVIINFTIPRLKEKILSGEKDRTTRVYYDPSTNKYNQKWKNLFEIKMLNKRDKKWKKQLQLYWKLRTSDSMLLKETTIKDLTLFRWEELNEVSLSNVQKYIRWMDIAKREGFQTLQEYKDILEKLYNPKDDHVFIIIRWMVNSDG